MKSLKTKESYVGEGIENKILDLDIDITADYEKQVKVCIGKIFNLHEDEIKDIHRLGGRTNKSFKVTMNNEDFVVRFPGKGTEEFIDRVNEKYNAHIAYNLSLDSEATYFDVNTGFKVSRFIEGAETLNKDIGKEKNNIKLMAKGLRTLHCCHQVFQNDFNPFERIEFYEKALEEIVGQVSEEYKLVKAKCMALEKELKGLGKIHRVPCHIDPLPENFIKVGDEKIYVIDWEYSGNYDAIWDLAAVCLECDFSDGEEEILLKSYFQGISINDHGSIRYRINVYKIVQDMFWCTWAAAKAARGDDYLIEYAKFKFARVKSKLESNKK